MECYTKFNDQTLTVRVTTVPVILLTNGLTLGYSASERIGSQVSMGSLRVSYGLSAADNTPPCFVRTLVVLDRQANKATPVVLTGVLQSNPLVFTDYGFNSIPRYTVIYDKVDPQNATFTGGSCVVQHDFTLDLNGLVAQYTATSTGTIADIVTNSLTVIFICTNDGGPNVTVYTRLIYDDT